MLSVRAAGVQQLAVVTLAVVAGLGGNSSVRAQSAPTVRGDRASAVVRVAPAPVSGPLYAGAQPRANADLPEITSAEKISIKVQGQKDLSGDYRINADQTVSIPVIGRIAIGHLDAAGLEKLLAERIARLTGREAYVTVEVVEYRPVFVSGYVGRPGSAPWTPGMTVLQAITVTGGAFRSGVDTVDTKQQRAIDDQKRVLATIARLNAEKNGASVIPIPPRLIALVGRREAEELIAAQQTSFLSRKTATEAQAENLQRSISLAGEELETLRGQRQRFVEQLKFRQAQYAKLKAVYDKQFLRVDRLSEEEVRIADLQEKVASLSVSLSRIEGTLATLQRDLLNFRQDRQALIDTDLMKLERDSAQLELDIEAAGPAPRRAIRTLSDSDPTAPPSEALRYEIVRQDGKTPRTMTADRTTLLKPGDMVVVSVQ